MITNTSTIRKTTVHNSPSPLQRNGSIEPHNRIPQLDEPVDEVSRISEIRSAIENGGYDTERRLEIALDRMIDSLCPPSTRLSR